MYMCAGECWLYNFKPVKTVGSNHAAVLGSALQPQLVDNPQTLVLQHNPHDCTCEYAMTSAPSSWKKATYLGCAECSMCRIHLAQCTLLSLQRMMLQLHPKSVCTHLYMPNSVQMRAQCCIVVTDACVIVQSTRER